MQYNVAENLSSYEAGRLDEDAVIKLFQYLANDGQVWGMDAKYGKKAVELSEAGRITLPDIGLDTTYFFNP